MFKMVLVVSLFTFLFSTSCTFKRLEDDLVAYDVYRDLRGELIDTTEGEGSIFLFYFQVVDGERVVKSFTYHTRAEPFYSLYGGGEIQLFSYKDLNNNLTYDAYEPAVLSPILSFDDSVSMLPEVVLTLAKSDELLVDFLISFSKSGLISDSEDRWANGAISPLGSEVYRSENANTAYWEPMRFVDSIGGGIFFESAYDPTKIPLLFIHGAAGTPQEFEDLVAEIDTSKYQPWYYFYASGLRLDVTVEVLHRLLNKQWQEYHFKNMAVVAHSMGGLVARGYIQRHYNPKAYEIPLFISLSTPWNGHAGAQAGIDMAPAIVPSWIDMAPHSEYINSLFEKPLPHNVHHHLLFGVRGGSSRFTGTNDETVSIASEIYGPAQGQAEKIYGYDETHTSILSAEASVKQVRALSDHYFVAPTVQDSTTFTSEQTSQKEGEK